MLKHESLQSEIDNAGDISKNKTTLIWVKRGNDIFPVKVKTGLSDGINTEITGDIKEGDEVVLGVGTSKNNAGQTAKSPFMPSFPSGKK